MDCKLMAATHNVPEEHVKLMHAQGLTPEVVEKAAAKGIGFVQLWQLWQKYGPTVMAIISDVMDMLKS